MKTTFQKALSIFLTVLLLLSITPISLVPFASAAEDTIEWIFDGETLVVSGSGELSSVYTSTADWKNMQDKCVNVFVEGDVTIIGKNAFKDFSAVKKLEVTSPLITVDEYAFSGCTALEEITLPDTVLTIEQYAFADCSAVKSFVFPAELREIGAWAFRNFTCFDEKPLVLPDSLQKVSLGSFHGADITSLTAPFVGYGPLGSAEDSKGSANIGTMFGDKKFPNAYVCLYRNNNYHSEYYYIPNSLKEVTITKNLYAYNFQNAKMIEKITIKETVEETRIPTSFANKCQGLKEVVIENSDKITKIDSSAFDCCYALEEFTIPQNVTEIGYRAFALCGFDSIEIPQKVEVIGGYAFFKCVGITSVVIPDSVTSIGECAFKGCSNLKNVKMPSTYYSIGAGVFDETQYTGTEDEFVFTEDGELLEYRGNDTVIVIPDSVTRIGTVFSGNKDITSIILPDGLLYLEENAFKGCSALTTINLPDGLSYISENTFYGCSSLTQINLPDGLSYIPENAFYGCSSLAEVIIPDTVLEIKANAFNGCCEIKELVVPDSVVKIEYRAFAGMCGLEKLTVPFVGQSRDVETDTFYSIIGYWFDSSEDEDYEFYCGKCHNSFEYLTQEYNHRSSPYDYYYSRRVYKPCNFKELTITEGTLRSHALNEFGLEVLNVGANVEVIEEYAADNLGLTELNLHEDAKFTEIPDYAFTKNSITTITIPKNVKRIGKAFRSNALTEINLNEGLEVIDGSFVNAKITSIDLPDSLIKIGGEAFWCCQKLEYIEFPENLTEIGFWAFYRSGLKEVVFSESITYISRGAFHKCPLKKIVLPESVASIVDETFWDCTELEIVVIGGRVEEIGPSAFANCTSLETVVIPDSVTSISEDAFTDSNLDMVIYCNEGSYAEEYAIQNNIKYTTLVLSAIPNQIYTGEAVEPEVKAKANNRPLTLNTEYKLSYVNNVDVGVAGVTARGLGDFKHLIAKGKFNILARQLTDVTIDYQEFTYYSPDGIEPDLALYMGNNLLVEGVDYEVIGLDKLTGVGTYNIAIKGIGNLSGTKNLTLDVLPRSITKARLDSKGAIQVTDSGYTLVEGVDYKIEKRTTETGEMETYVVGIGNYADEKKVSSTGDAFETNLLYRLFAFFEKILSLFRGVLG